MSFVLGKASVLRPGELKFGDNKLNFKYDPSAYTPDHEDKVEEAKEDNKAGSTLKAWLIPLIKEWDIVDLIPEVDNDGNEVVGTDGQPVMVEVPVPIDEVGLGRVPLEVLGKIMSSIGRDMSEGAGEEKSTSSGGSFS